MPTLALALLRFVVYLGGHPAGHAELTMGAAQTRDFSFTFRDRSLGPRLHERVVVDTAGIPTAVQVSGLDRAHNRVDERYVRTAGERGFYISEQQLPLDAAVLARALSKAPGGTLPLVGGGAAHLKRGPSLTLRAGKRRARVTAYAVEGLDLGLWDLHAHIGFDDGSPAPGRRRDQRAQPGRVHRWSPKGGP